MIHMLINNLSGGGAEKQFIQLARAISPSSITLITNKIEYDITDLKNITILDQHNKYKFFLKVFPLLSRLFLCIRHFRKVASHSCVIISFMERENYINILLKRFFNHKAIVSVRNTPSRKYRYAFHYRWLIKRLYPMADGIVPISYGIKQDLITRFNIPNEKINVVEIRSPNPDEIKAVKDGIDSELARELKSKQVILNVGRMVKIKGQIHLIRICPKLIEAIPNIHIVIVGKGPYKAQLCRMIETLNLQDYVTLHPFLSNPYSFMQLAECFVMPSYFEGFGNVLLEAMMVGLPVLATDCESGPREVLNDCRDYSQKLKLPLHGKYGILLPELTPPKKNDPLSPSELAMTQEIIDLLNSESRLSFYKKQSRIGAEQFSTEVMNKKWAKVISDLSG